MGLRELARAVARMPTAPCDDCFLAKRCAVSALACEAFRIYTEPKRRRPWVGVERVPNRATYNAVFSPAS